MIGGIGYFVFLRIIIFLLLPAGLNRSNYRRWIIANTTSETENPGLLSQSAAYDFSFKNVERQYESYMFHVITSFEKSKIFFKFILETLKKERGD